MDELCRGKYLQGCSQSRVYFTLYELSLTKVDHIEFGRLVGYRRIVVIVSIRLVLPEKIMALANILFTNTAKHKSNK